jgi:hypothetical protein
MIKTILAATLLTITMASGVSAASMKPMMKKMDHSMSMKKKCGKGMMLMHGKCMADHGMKKMMKK